MRCSRQLLPCRDENRRPPAANRRPGGCRSRRYTRPPPSILLLGPRVPSVPTLELHAARPSPTRKRGVRYAALSELPVHEALLLHTGSASRALEHIASHILGAHVLISTGRRCSLSRHLLCSLVHAADRASCTALSLGDGAAHAWGTPPYRTSLLFACYRVRERASDARVYRVVL